jgi:hypothetical protein
LQYYERDRGNGIAMHLYVPYPSIQHRLTASGSRRARPRWAVTPSAQTDERRGITSAARNQPMAGSCPPFWMLFCPGLGYYSADGEAPKNRSFPEVGFPARVRIHLPPAESLSLARLYLSGQEPWLSARVSGLRSRRGRRESRRHANTESSYRRGHRMPDSHSCEPLLAPP